MIKRNKGYKQKLLNKEEQTSINNESFFELEDMSVCPSEIMQERELSYYCLQDEIKNNPYMLDDEEEPKVPKKTTQEPKLEPKKLPETKEYYQKIPQSSKPQQKKGLEMKVKCGKCMTPQAVPATSKKFICYSCSQVCLCSPQYKLFICGGCNVKVYYPPGVSQYIKCTRCETVNMIP